MRKCKFGTTHDFNNLDDAKTSCEKDAECHIISTSDQKCHGPFQLCKGNTTEHWASSCILQRGTRLDIYLPNAELYLQP